jgi:hypothetical protein
MYFIIFKVLERYVLWAKAESAIQTDIYLAFDCFIMTDILDITAT